MWYFSALLTQLALLCSWFVDGGLFLDFPFNEVLNLHFSKPPNMTRLGCVCIKNFLRTQEVSNYYYFWNVFSQELLN